MTSREPKDAGNPLNKSNFQANAGSRRETRENLFEQTTIGSGFTSDWIKEKWREFF